MGHRLIHYVVSADEVSSEQRQQALADYVRLLENDSAKPEDAAKFKAACERIGKKPNDLHKDLQAIRYARDLQERIKRGANQDDEMDAASKAVQESEEEKQRFLLAWAEQHRQKLEVRSAISERHQEAQRAEQLLHEHKSKHGEVLAHVELLRIAQLDHRAVAAEKDRAEAKAKAEAEAKARDAAANAAAEKLVAETQKLLVDGNWQDAVKVIAQIHAIDQLPPEWEKKLDQLRSQAMNVRASGPRSAAQIFLARPPASARPPSGEMATAAGFWRRIL